MKLSTFIPAFSWLKNYNSGYFKSDLAAGATVGIMLIPQGMAYALIAGLPPVYGLYAAIMPQIIYAFMGTSRQLSVGPVAMDSLIVAASLGALKLSGIEEYVSMALFLALFMGSIQFLLGVFRLGFLVNFLSKPVISAFTSAAALIIGLNQLKYVLGVSLLKSNQLHLLILDVFKKIDKVHLLTLGVSVIAFILLKAIKKYAPKLPGSLLLVILSIAVVYLFRLDQHGLNIVKEIPSGLPSFSFSFFEVSRFKLLNSAAISLALIAFMEAISVAKAIEEKHDDYKVNANQELIALGLSNMVGSLFQAYPTTGGFSRTAVSNDAGAKTGVSAIIAALIISLTLLFLTPLFYYLPTAILGVIIIAAIINLIDLEFPKKLWSYKKDEFALYLFTFLITAGVGIKEGILYGIGLSLLFLIYRVSYPHIAVLGNIPESKQYRNISRFADLQTWKDIIIIRFDAQLFFANAQYFKDFINDKLRENKEVKHIVLDFGAINSIDSTAIKMLTDLEYEMKTKRKEIYFVEVKGPVRDMLAANMLLNETSINKYFLEVDEAIKHIHKEEIKINPNYLLQSKK